MVKIKNMFILLLIFTLSIIPAAYPKGPKKREINYLPPDTTMESVRKDYGNDPIEISQIDVTGSKCEINFNGMVNCRKCLRLKNDCPDCCLTTVAPTDKQAVTKCSDEDTSGDYKCPGPPFTTDCDSTDDENDTSECKGSSSEGKTSNVQKKGCPEVIPSQDHEDDLAPDTDTDDDGKDDGSCGYEEGAGLERIWECDSPDYQPNFAGCDPKPESGLKKPQKYYDVTTIETGCKSICESNACLVDCGSSSSGGCSKNGSFSCPGSSCTPHCSHNFSYSGGKLHGAGAGCKGEGCEPPSLCLASCVTEKGNMLDTCKANPCYPSCGASSCKSYSSRWENSPKNFYVYALTDEFKEYLKECNKYADEYEECEDRRTCCQEGACAEEDDDPGDLSNYDYHCRKKGGKCEERAGCLNAGVCSVSIEDAGDCIEKVRQAAQCLIENPGLFQKIDKRSDAQYNFIAGSGESFTIEWQLVLESLSVKEKEALEGLDFYTMVQVIGDASGSVEHTSMLNIRDMDNVFSIHGMTHIPKNKLKAGRKYTAGIYYFLPGVYKCKWDKVAERAEKVTVTDRRLKVKQLFLDIIMVKE